MRVKMPPSVRIVQGDHADQGMLILHREICCLGRSDAEPPDDLSSCRICQRPFELGGMTRFVRQHVLRQQPPATSLPTAYPSQQPSRRGPASSDEEASGDPPAGINGGDGGGSRRRVSGDVRSAVTVQVNGGSPPVSPGSEVSQVSQMRSTGEPEGKRLRQEDDDKPSSVNPLALSEPMSYACFTCSASFSTAWALIQHVQGEHNLKICASSAKGNCSQAASPRSESDSPISSPPKYSKTVEDDCSMSASRRSPSPLRSILPTLPHPNPPIVSSSHPGASSFDLPFFRLPTADKHFPSLLGSPFSRPPTGHDFRMENIISEQFRLHPHLPLIPFDRRPFDLSTHPRPSLGLPLEPMDFYSQRLRQLAGTNHHSPAAIDLMNARKKPRSSSPAFSTPVSGPSQSAPITTETGTLPKPSPGPGLNSVTGKPKAVRKERPRACEYCHKIFRFQSNLIVHRRIHTGEKPYKCKICSHACTQSSKLKRHMKTHINELDSSIEKNSQASDDVKEEDDSSVQGDEEEEDPMDDEEEDSFDMGETDGPEDLSTKSTYSVCLSLPTEPNTTPTGTTEKSSLVGELMDKFGLSNINAYREAYSQALRESVKEETRDEDFDNEISVDSDQSDEETRDSGKENGSDSGGCDEKPTIKIRNEFLLTQPVLDLSRGTMTGSLDSQYDPTKRVHLSGSEAESGLLPGLWLPPIGVARDFPFAPHATSDFLTHSKGVVEGSLKAVNQQSLRQPFGLKPPGQVSADSSTPPPIGKRDRGQSNRRDTCEYCGKIFKNCSNLTVHRRSHTGEKPYHCTMCSYACAQSSKLTRHMKTHGRMGKDVYQCRFCSMPFSVASTLEKHMRKCVVSQNSKGAGVLPPVLPGH